MVLGEPRLNLERLQRASGDEFVRFIVDRHTGAGERVDVDIALDDRLRSEDPSVRAKIVFNDRVLDLGPRLQAVEIDPFYVEGITGIRGGIVIGTA